VTRLFREWLLNKWRRNPGKDVLHAYRVTFDSLHGRVVLQHLLDEVYCQVCPTHDPIDLATHNGRRSVVHEMLELVDQAEWPDKYVLTNEGAETHGH